MNILLYGGLVWTSFNRKLDFGSFLTLYNFVFADGSLSYIDKWFCQYQEQPNEKLKWWFKNVNIQHSTFVIMDSYSYNDPLSCPSLSPSPPAYTSYPPISENDQVTILVKLPRLSSCKWCLKLYATVFGGCGALFSFLWLFGHIYVLFQTEDSDLRWQR